MVIKKDYGDYKLEFYVAKTLQGKQSFNIVVNDGDERRFRSFNSMLVYLKHCKNIMDGQQIWGSKCNNLRLR